MEEAERCKSNPCFWYEDGITFLEQAVESVSKLIMKTLSFEESLHYCKNIRSSVQAVRKLDTSCNVDKNHIFYGPIKKVVVSFWDKIQDHKIRDQCDKIEKLFKIVRELFPEEIQGLKEKCLDAIVEVWRKLLEEDRKMNQHNNDNKALEDGDIVERVSKLTSDLNCPDMFLENECR